MAQAQSRTKRLENNASDFPVLRKYVEEQRVGIVVPPDNPEEIARLVRPLLTQPVLLAEMRTVARRLGESTYNWEAQAPVLTGLYDRLASRHSSERGH